MSTRSQPITDKREGITDEGRADRQLQLRVAAMERARGRRPSPQPAKTIADVEAPASSRSQSENLAHALLAAIDCEK